MREIEEEKVKKAYLYLVKMPAGNELSVCAFDNVCYPGTSVIYPTKYGLDLGIVVCSVEKEGRQYVPGRRFICGACHLSHADQKSADSSLATIEELPNFKFESTNCEDLSENVPYDDADCWNSVYEKPKLIDVDDDTDWISRIATPEEIKKYNDNQKEEQNADLIFNEKVAKHGLDMKLVVSHFLLGEPKLLFFFTSEGRVDFRELVKDLVSVFRLRIELRQIGVRDEARVLGGLAVCGRDFCCHCVSDKLKPVTIKMAKEQNLSLNSLKISGPCSRLLCCLSYEYDFYCEEKSAYPPEGAKFRIGQEFFRVIENNVLVKKVVVVNEDGGELSIPRAEVRFNADKQRWEVSDEFAGNFFSN